MSKWYLIRHGETSWNVLGKYQGSSDIPLSLEGQKQAQALKDKMAFVSLSAIYSSDLQRAYETAKTFAPSHQLPIQSLDLLREINFGEWEGYTAEELRKKYGQSYEQFVKEPFSYSFPGEGSLQKVQQRAKKAIEIIQQNHPTGNVAIVAHGGILKVMMIALLGWDLSFYKQFWLGNTSVSTIRLKQNGKHVLECLNDTCHLK
ncbi:MAG: histidine phosphatase family protein [Epulopiscium sp.]|nr:histidine phosphatase family protein [Candidatus Epulonipiscium sp.]